MRKRFISCQLYVLLITFVCLFTVSSWASADDRCALVIGTHDNLVIFGPNGDQIKELSVPSIATAITVGGNSFQVSYGRDTDNNLMAIVAPSSNELHFMVLGRNIDATGGAVVTLTFLTPTRVTIDPGFIGSVTVNSHSIRSPEQFAGTVSPRSSPPAPASSPSPASAPRPVPRTSTDIKPRELPPLAPPANPAAPAAPATPATPATPAAPANTNAPTNPAASASAAKVKYYWSEPVTPPNGSPPAVNLDQMKLVEVHGVVSVKTADGTTQSGTEGMMIASNSTILTSDNATAALFMGGVNSARLMPNCELTVTQDLKGDVRKTTLALDHGAVFSRIGHRVGETQDFEVKTPEGLATAHGTEMLTFRGNKDAIRPSMALSPTLKRSQLLAWDPAPLRHGLISDVASPIIDAAEPNTSYFFIYCAKGKVQCTVNGKMIKVVLGNPKHINHAVLPPYKGDDADAGKVFQDVLEVLQPFNFKLNGLLDSINNGTANPGQKAFYNNLFTVSLGN